MSPTEYQLVGPAICFLFFCFYFTLSNRCPPLGGYEPNELPNLHTAICLLLFCFYSTLSNRCPPLGGYEPNELPTAPPRNMSFTLLFLFYSFEPMSAAWRI